MTKFFLSFLCTLALLSIILMGFVSLATYRDAAKCADKPVARART